MRHSFFYRMKGFLLGGVLLSLWGCANMMETMPTPPAFLVSVELNGPYDQDIPTPQTNQIKSASLMLDWAVPYLFISVGSHFESAGDQERSIHFFNRAIDEFRKRNNGFGEGSAFNRKISALIRFGQLQTAYQAVEKLEKNWTHPPFNAFVFYSYGTYHLKNGDYAKSRDYFGQALAANLDYLDHPDLLALRRDAELGYGMTLILADYFPIMSGQLCLTDFDEAFYQDIRRNISDAIFHLEQVPLLNKQILNTKVRRYFPEILPPYVECDAFNYLGLSYGIAGKTSEALKILETAKKIVQKAGYLLGEADGIFFLNQVYLLDKNRLEGLKAVQALTEIADRYQLVPYSIWANLMLAHHLKATGDTDRMIKAMNKALTLMEENVTWLSRDADFRGIGLFKRQVMYETLLELYVSKRNDREAFQTAERSKMVLLADRLSGDVIGKIPTVQEDLRHMHLHRKQLAQQYKKLLSPVRPADAFRQTVEEIDKARRAYAKLIAGMKQQGGTLYSLVSVTPPETDDLQRLLDDNTTLFAYYVGEQYLYVWVMSKNRFHQEKIRMSRNDVDLLLQAYRSAMMSKDKMKADYWAEKAYDTFLKPVLPFVYGDRVGFIPHGPLYNLPFASMRYVQSYLVDGFTIFYLPHAGMLNPLMAEHSAPVPKKAMILTDARCVGRQGSAAYAGMEMDMLKSIFPQADYFVADFSDKDSFQKYTGNYDVIHGVLNDCFLEEVSHDPVMLSAAAEPYLACPSLRDIFRLRLSSSTAVLSICRAESDLSVKGAGTIALTSAWLYTVSPQIVTQLWEVEEKARASLMEMFYKDMKKSGSAAEALRTAQNGMIQMGYGMSDWAAFILTGRY